MKPKKDITPEKSSINLDIESIENKYFSNETDKNKKRSMAFQLLCHSIISDIDIEEILDEDIIDGNDEEGIDIFFIDQQAQETNVDIINCKSSFRDNYSANDMDKIGSGLYHTFEERLDNVKMLGNIKLKNKINMLRDLKEDVKNVNFYYCVFNGSTLSPNVGRKKKLLEDRYNSFFRDQYKNAQFNLFCISSDGLFRLKTRNSQSLKDVTLKIPYFDKNQRMRYEIKTENGVEGYLTTFKGEEIAKLVLEYGDLLFEKNIRGWLKYNKKNQEIYDSCTSKQSNFFWFLNNGITIIGDKIFADDDKTTWNITNLQIINGQQTARMLSEALRGEKLKSDVKVMCRLYQTNETDFISKVTKATNSQSSIGSRDLMSNDPKQIAIQKAFRTYGYFYERQRGEIINDKALTKVITSKKLGQVSLAILCKRPSLARKNIEDNFFNTKKFYYEIFDRDPKLLLFAYLLYNYCDSKKNIDNSLSYFGSLHIARIVFELKEKDFNENPLDLIKNLEDGTINLKAVYSESIKMLRQFLPKNRIQEDYLGNYLSRIEVDQIIFDRISRLNKLKEK